MPSRGEPSSEGSLSLFVEAIYELKGLLGGYRAGDRFELLRGLSPYSDLTVLRSETRVMGPDGVLVLADRPVIVPSNEQLRQVIGVPGSISPMDDRRIKLTRDPWRIIGGETGAKGPSSGGCVFDEEGHEFGVIGRWKPHLSLFSGEPQPGKLVLLVPVGDLNDGGYVINTEVLYWLPELPPQVEAGPVCSIRREVNGRNYLIYQVRAPLDKIDFNLRWFLKHFWPNIPWPVRVALVREACPTISSQHLRLLTFNSGQESKTMWSSDHKAIAYLIVTNFERSVHLAASETRRLEEDFVNAIGEDALNYN